MARGASTRFKLDPITLEVIRHGPISGTNQIDANITRRAFSPYIYEQKDCEVGLIDAHGSLIAQDSGGMPIFVADAGRHGGTARPCRLWSRELASLRPANLQSCLGAGPASPQRCHVSRTGGGRTTATTSSTSSPIYACSTLMRWEKFVLHIDPEREPDRAKTCVTRAK
jgi:hypothetical protein